MDVISELKLWRNWRDKRRTHLKIAPTKTVHKALCFSRAMAWVDISFTAQRSRRRSSSGCSMNRNSRTTYGWSSLIFGACRGVSHLSEDSSKSLLDWYSTNYNLYPGLWTSWWLLQNTSALKAMNLFWGLFALYWWVFINYLTLFDYKISHFDLYCGTKVFLEQFWKLALHILLIILFEIILSV